MKYENLSKLISTPIVKENLEKQEFTIINYDDNKYNELINNENNNNNNLTNIFYNNDILNYEKIQLGTFRTNCIDCLDRTNEVQSVFARNILHRMLIKLNLSEEEEKKIILIMKKIIIIIII